MHYRPPSRVLSLGIVTLGFYDLYWLGVTHAELKKVTQIRLKSAWWLAVVFISRLAGMTSIVWVILTLSIDSLSNSEGRAWLLLTIAAILGFVVNYLLFPHWLIPYVRAAQVASNGAVQESNAMLLLMTREVYGITVLQQAYNNPESMPGFMSKDVTVAAKNLTNNARRLENPMLRRILIIVAAVIAIGLILLLLFPFFVAHIG